MGVIGMNLNVWFYITIIGAVIFVVVSVKFLITFKDKTVEKKWDDHIKTLNILRIVGIIIGFVLAFVISH